MNYYVFAYAYLFTAFLPVIIGVAMIRQLDEAARIFLLMVAVSFLGELAAFCTAVVYRNNLPAYNISSIIEMVILCFYFNYIIGPFRKHHLGIIIGAVSLIVAILTLIYGQPITKVNNYFMVYQGIVIISMSMIYQVQLLRQHPYLGFKDIPHYWFTSALMFFWTLTVLNWAFYDYLYVRFPVHRMLLNYAIALVALITYLAFCATFLLYSKMRGNVRR